MKILGVGDLTAKVEIEAALASRSAIAAVEAAGGTVKVLRDPKVKADAAA